MLHIYIERERDRILPCKEYLNMFQHLSLFTHTALDIFEFGQDVKAETISLASGSVSTIHEVTKGQNQTKNPLHGLTVLQRLQR